MAHAEKRGKRTVGRPKLYCQEVAERFCERIEAGDSIRKICARPDMPCWETVRKWLRENPEFLAQYQLARQASAEALEHQVLEEAYTAVDPKTAAAASVRIKALQWIAAKRAPRVYGDKIDLDVSSEARIKQMSDEQLNDRINELLGKVGLTLSQIR